MQDVEKEMMLIANAGEARSKALEAIQAAKIKEVDRARSLLAEARVSSRAAHKIQTSLLQQEASGNKYEVSVLLIHAQDHLMNAITVIDLAETIVDLFEASRD
ncbi:PTS lactose/cellobiose transporter subunit IIA [Paenibacillus antibioticophila]|uniref:PTS lactose/cellobiose transporter subunit IIA n=1 Tax=Paenibacillus antibioticophila TaxID=1274374 RepID=UPI0005C8526D|nr:PTS lactose/cellobiose transporter subunit IIA [Paenibacillus antibioticophila]